jgi:probable HAF family extracellular repeat protein
MKRKLFAITMLLGLAINIPGAAAQSGPDHPTRYVVKDLGTLGGNFSGASGINDFGSVTGSTTLAGDTIERAFVWRHGRMTDLGTLGGPDSSTLTGGTPQINGSGMVVGFSDTSTPDPLGEQFFCGFGNGLICLPFVWQHGVMTALPTLGGNNAFADSVNRNGLVTGLAENSVHDPTCIPPQVLQFKPVYWWKGAIHELSPLPGDTSGEAEASNDHGQIVGGSFPDCAATSVRAVLWDNGTATDLGTLGGSVGSGIAINNRGLVVGASNLAGDETSHAFVWTKKSGMNDIGVLPGDFTSTAIGVNDQGQAVGLSCDDSDNCSAFLWQRGHMADLNRLVAGRSSLHLLLAYDINSNGQIVGSAVTRNGEEHAFLATPCDQQGDDQGCSENDVSGAEELSRAQLTDHARRVLQRRLPFNPLTRRP